MSANGKITVWQSLFAEYAHLFICPICSGRMAVDHLKSLICPQGHCFDLAKPGYVHLLPRAAKTTKYDGRLFEARRLLHERGYFEPLISALCGEIANRLPALAPDKPVIMDAGCGEGSHLSAILHKLGTGPLGAPLGIGIDISKEGIRLAAKHAAADVQNGRKERHDILWCVSDLAQNPFADGGMHGILNLLSPSNYAEFKRLLAPGGLLIKVVPETEYLQPLRARFYGDSAKKSYSNARTVERFAEHFELVLSRRIQYPVTLRHDEIRHLVAMTPLLWNLPADQAARVTRQPELTVMFDYRVLIGTNRCCD
ncbi:methyltransferase domain-containing protein [Paenibacillus macerans]|uniref:Methyltransferase domain-containing protein n=1 Tax=Paenibacillus macerans TaxID=44252 RepID=A0A6N8EVN9_PAEMA|nr:methyltransferase domain-containing protein [Paenibacillus macerans]MUG24316.1 methyltransferase domain-containing protein [Paenibacillus macerans]UMV50326.1 methyltransferase domain-containing protein [Paenibacillus macerans]